MEWYKEFMAEAKKHGIAKVHNREDWNNWVERQKPFLRKWEVSYEWGSDKVCLIFNDHRDYVLKAYIAHATWTEYDRGVIECANYCKAVRDGFGQFFAETIPVCVVGNLFFYLQEYLNPDEDDVTSMFEDYVASHSEYYNITRADYEDEDEWNSAVCDTADELDNDERIYAVYGETKETNRLVEFLWDNGINDLHAANWGWIPGTGNLVIMDFSGYGDDNYFESIKERH